MGVLLYFAIGVFWGYFAWVRFVDAEVKYYEKERQRFLRFHKIDGDALRDAFLYEWRNHVKTDPRLQAVPPQAQNFTGEILFDVSLWPVSIAMRLILLGSNKFIDRIFVEYNRVTNEKVVRIKKDLEG
jgi:hypothetical protein